MANPRRFPASTSRNHGLHHSIHEGKSSMVSYQAQERARTQEPRLDPKDPRERPRYSGRVRRDHCFYRGGGGCHWRTILEGSLCSRKQNSIFHRLRESIVPEVVFVAHSPDDLPPTTILRPEVSALHPLIVSGHPVLLEKPSENIFRNFRNFEKSCHIISRLPLSLPTSPRTSLTPL
jgi:hypothetical protein